MFHVKHRGSHAAPSPRSAANLSEHACKPVYVDRFRHMGIHARIERGLHIFGKCVGRQRDDLHFFRAGAAASAQSARRLVSSITGIITSMNTAS